MADCDDDVEDANVPVIINVARAPLLVPFSEEDAVFNQSTKILRGFLDYAERCLQIRYAFIVFTDEIITPVYYHTRLDQLWLTISF